MDQTDEMTVTECACRTLLPARQADLPTATIAAGTSLDEHQFAA